MARWTEFEEQAPELAATVRARLEAHRHHTLATLRRDGGPRICGSEVSFQDGDLWIGSMWQARKARDLQRDPRYALHSASEDPPGWPGDAKIAGVAEEILDQDEVRRRNGEAGANGPTHLFRLDLGEASAVHVDEAAEEIVIDLWTADAGVRRIRRRG